MYNIFGNRIGDTIMQTKLFFDDFRIDMSY